MTRRIFLAKDLSPYPSPTLSLLFREAIAFLFPNAVSTDGLGREFSTPHCFCLREGEDFLWFQLALVPFSRSEISDYLAKARQIQMSFPSGIYGILAAPDFEAGVQELLEFVRIPIRLFRYREVISLEIGEPSRSSIHESVLWIEELTPSSSKISLPFPPRMDKTTDTLLEESPSSYNRLNREELGEFIQFELDDASHKYKS